MYVCILIYVRCFSFKYELLVWLRFILPVLSPNCQVLTADKFCAASLCFNWGTCFMRRSRRVSCNFGGKTITLSWSTKTPSSLYPINVSEKIMCILRASECFIILSPTYKDIYAIDKFTKDRKITLFWISTKTLGLCVSEGICPASSICTTGLYQRKGF